MSDSRPRVLKFGGSSQGAPDRLARTLDIVADERARGPIAVVVSAMGDTTDWLIEAVEDAAAGRHAEADAMVSRVVGLAVTNANGALAAHRSSPPRSRAATPLESRVQGIVEPLRKLLYGISLVRERTPQMLDLALSFGERISAAVLVDLLEARDIPAFPVDARTWTVTDDRFGSAVVDWDATRARVRTLLPSWADRVPVHTGFIGQTPDGRTTTLGRNGSDYTATLLARAVDAADVTIWTDVAGVMTADPTIVADAYPLAHLSYREALELANFGARMFHPRTMIPLIESGIPLRIRQTMRSDLPGTLVDASGSNDENRPTSVTSLEDLAMLDIQWSRLGQQAQIAARVLHSLDSSGVTVWMATEAAHGQAVGVVVPRSHIERAHGAIVSELAPELTRHEVEPIGVRAPVTLLTLVAEAMGQTVNVAGRFFSALGNIGVNIRAIGQGASSRSVSCVIDAEMTRVAVRTVHSAFNFAHQDVSLLVLGKGHVGRNLIEQVWNQHAKLLRDHDVRIRVVGLADRHRLLFDEQGIAPDDWRARLEAAPAADSASSGILVEAVDRLRQLPLPILVDCTAAEGMEVLYAEAFRRGVHVVGANKKPLAIPWSRRSELVALSRRAHRAWRYETTVGASLPVIDSLRNLVRTGDRVLLVEGSFSGTLGYLNNEVMRGVPLSAAVRTAWELGYTEPDPRDDLSGLDVARKALILARELDLPLELSDVVVEPFVPAAVMTSGSVTAFLAQLADHDADFAARVETIRARGQVLRYLARIDPAAASHHTAVHVGPVSIPVEHAATRLRGAEAFVAYTTERYQDYPLIVQGAGAGGAVTAAGVLADILAISQAVRGR